MEAVTAPTKTFTDKTNVRVLLYLIEHAPALAIDFAATLPRYFSLVSAVGSWNPMFVDDLPTDEALTELIEDAKQWLAEP
jgi:hypothetical protein